MPRHPQTLDPVTELITREADRELDKLVAEPRDEISPPIAVTRDRRDRHRRNRR